MTSIFTSRLLLPLITTILSTIRRILIPICVLPFPAWGDSVGWVCHQGRGGLRWVEVPSGSEKYALEAWGSPAWDTFVYSAQPFRRGNRLRCTFRLIGNLISSTRTDSSE